MDGTYAVEMVTKLFREKGVTYDLILMDYTMPEMNGVDATKAIRKFFREDVEARVKAPHICLLTSYNDEKLKELALKSGTDSYACKPIFLKEIVNLLRSAGIVELPTFE